MKTVLNALIGTIDTINRWTGWLLAALLLVMTVLITWQVFARFVMGSPLTFSEEVARFAMIWMTMLGAAYAYRHGTLISVDVFTDIAGPRATRILKVVIAIISFVFAYVLLTEGFSITLRVAGQTAPSTRVSMAWLYAAMPAGAALIALNAVAVALDALRAPLAPRPSLKEADA
ncbi:TRAP transporter small permease [Limimaricola hongkongensis]|uniref:TRAP transporter small permease protein n=1 Tax=Limimaricola hongkongensis DSM 17492 TaxID=1122180 RepID=A0A017HA84_9RHOB|nr:TRAP transporter small permease [Limimaricola hongkongensis]EYD71412.1 C4-dicarboxylate transport system permease small protein [Limimaricola hongkongensis DSM 17492]